MRLEHFNEIWDEHQRKAEEAERNKQRVADYYEKLAETQCNDDYSVRLKGEEK